MTIAPHRESTASAAPPELLIKEARRRGRLHLGFVALIVFAMVVALVALTVYGIGDPPPNRVHEGTKPPSNIGRVVLDRVPRLEVYDYSGNVKFRPTPVFVTRVGSRATPQALASGMWAGVAATSSSSDDLAVYGGPGNFAPTTIYQMGRSGATLRLRASRSWSIEQGAALFAAGHNLYLRSSSGPAQFVLQVDIATGKLVRSYGVAGLPFTRPLGYRGPILGPTSTGYISALVEDAGSLFAFQYNGQAAAIDDLSTGTRVLLPSFGALGGGAVGADGGIYVLAWPTTRYGKQLART